MPDLSLLDLPVQIAMALSLASSTTGADLDYLLRTAQRESSFQADARASTSSAEGLFQFIEETWIRTIKDEGEQYGLGEYAAMIEKTTEGRYAVANPAHRRAILALRRDPRISAVMAGAYATRNAEHIAEEIGRRPTSAELYMAHFLGPSDAVRLIQFRDTRQSLSAPDLFPRAAAANRKIFYADSQPRSVGQVYDLLASRHEQTLARRRPAFTGQGVDTGLGSWSAQVSTASTIVRVSSVRSGAEPAMFTDGAIAEPASTAWLGELDGSQGEVIAAMPLRVTALGTDGDEDSTDIAGTATATANTGALRVSVADALAAPASSRLKVIRITR